MTQAYLGTHDGKPFTADHVDGNHNALQRARKLEWLGDGSDECHILSNARCLTEGVDVPALDAILFLSPRSSQIDVVQAVGRAMRRSDSTGKKFGYIIIPITVPPQENYEAVILDSRYNPTFQVLQALKSHDEDFYDTINQVDLRENKKISVAIFTDDPPRREEETENGDARGDGTQAPLNLEVTGKIREALFARIVDSLTDKHYYTKWAEETARINAQYEERIRGLLETDQDGIQKDFKDFHSALKRELNDGITEEKAISLLAQHLVTKPVFDALFSEFQFANHNPVAQAMERIIERLKIEHGTDAETKELEGFYRSIQRRIQYVDTAEKKQRIIADLYGTFFQKALPKEATSMGIVYTPVEAVDYVVRSVEDILISEFGTTISSKEVHVLDPFTGTGTFLTRLLSSGLIKPEDILRKYSNELHANDITLLAYYIATVNVEMTFHAVAEQADYTPFKGIVFADSFEARENQVAPRLKEGFFQANNERLSLQNDKDIRVIMSNPPWSVGQNRQNDDNQNRVYPKLRDRIARTYSAASNATLRRNAYDSYLQAIRMASDRIAESQHGGIIAFVLNGGFIDSKSADGFRKTISKEFHSIYCYNLRGDANTSGELRKKEKDGLFGGGSKAGVAILLLVKKPGQSSGATILYRDVGDYLTREEKLAILDGSRLADTEWETITPNAEGDWKNQRDPGFQLLTPLAGEKGSIFNLSSTGISTNRDAWCYGFSRVRVEKNTNAMMQWYNGQIPSKNPEKDPTKFSWSDNALKMAAKGTPLKHNPERLVIGQYRPFTKQIVYFDRSVVERVSQQEKIFPRPELQNLGIALNSKDKSSPLSCLMLNTLPNLHTIGDTRFLPLWIYVKSPLGNGYEKVSNINEEALNKFKSQLGTDSVTEDDIFHYVYAVLHHKSYRTRYATNLSKETARIPLPTSLESFNEFVMAGKELAELHINYETAEPYDLIEDVVGKPTLLERYRVTTKKMSHPGKRGEEDESALEYNEYITLRGIPEKAHRYIIGQYSALRWLRERYVISTDKDSGITDDPNDWAEENGDPKYIIDLIKRVVNISVKTIDIVDSLPELPTG